MSSFPFSVRQITNERKPAFHATIHGSESNLSFLWERFNDPTGLMSCRRSGESSSGDSSQFVRSWRAFDSIERRRSKQPWAHDTTWVLMLYLGLEKLVPRESDDWAHRRPTHDLRPLVLSWRHKFKVPVKTRRPTGGFRPITIPQAVNL